MTKTNKTRIVFLVSGSGGNLVFIHQLCSIFNFEIVGVMGDRDCSALKYAKEYKLKNEIFKFDRSAQDDGEIKSFMHSLNPNIIITNIHKVLSPEICAQFKNQLINLHYSLLPAFKGFIGMVSVKKALELNCQFIGSTCHYVDELVDNGQIIAQSILPVGLKTQVQLEHLVFKSGVLTLLTAILVVNNNSDMIESLQYGEIMISPGHTQIKNEAFDIDFFIKKTQDLLYD